VTDSALEQTREAVDPQIDGRPRRGARADRPDRRADLAGVGFTMSLPIGVLGIGIGIGIGTDRDQVKISVLSGSLTAACSPRSCCGCATVRRIHEAETADDDHDGVAELYA
jgi:hypothetical protein